VADSIHDNGAIGKDPATTSVAINTPFVSGFDGPQAIATEPSPNPPPTLSWDSEHWLS